MKPKVDQKVEAPAEDEGPKKKKTSCGDYMRRFDQLIMRPILIHKYEKDKEARAQDFYEMFQEDGHKVGKLFSKQMKAHAKAADGSAKGSAQRSGSEHTKDFLRAATRQMGRRMSRLSNDGLSNHNGSMHRGR